MSGASERITFVVPVLNDARRLASCLAAIRSDNPSAEVIVVDNGSIDDSRQVAIDAGATCLDRPGIPVSAMRNQAAAAAGGEIVAFVDADHRIGAGWSDAARQALSVAQVGAAGAPYVTDGRTWVQRAYDGLRSHPTAPQIVAWLGSGNLAVRRDAFVSTGGFDERLRTCEDVDFCRRLRAAGWRIVADPRMRSVHAGDPETLRAVVAGELWRGRDNLRVSFRPPVDLRGVVTAVMPAFVLAAVPLAVLFLAASRTAPAVALTGTAAALVFARMVQMSRRRGDWRPPSVLQTLLVATSYEAGRALALVARAGHLARRGRRS